MTTLLHFSSRTRNCYLSHQFFFIVVWFMYQFIRRIGYRRAWQSVTNCTKKTKYLLKVEMLLVESSFLYIERSTSFQPKNTKRSIKTFWGRCLTFKPSDISYRTFNWSKIVAWKFSSFYFTDLVDSPFCGSRIRNSWWSNSRYTMCETLQSTVLSDSRKYISSVSISHQNYHF